MSNAPTGGATIGSGRGCGRTRRTSRRGKRIELATAAPVREARVVPRFNAFCLSEYRPHAKLHLKAYYWGKQRYILAELVDYFDEDKLDAINAARVEAYSIPAARRREAGCREQRICACSRGC